MQFAKDSFYLALQQRLAGVDPMRTVTVNGATVPAILVPENLAPSSAERLPNVFYVEWGAASVVAGHAGSGALMSIDCVISYYTLGTVASMVDRGRAMGQLDTELLDICQPQSTEKMDYTQSPTVDLGTRVFWTLPVFGEKSKNATEQGADKHPDARVEREVQITIYFFTEVALS